MCLLGILASAAHSLSALLQPLAAPCLRLILESFLRQETRLHSNATSSLKLAPLAPYRPNHSTHYISGYVTSGALNTHKLSNKVGIFLNVFVDVNAEMTLLG